MTHNLNFTGRSQDIPSLPESNLFFPNMVDEVSSNINARLNEMGVHCDPALQRSYKATIQTAVEAKYRDSVLQAHANTRRDAVTGDMSLGEGHDLIEQQINKDLNQYVDYIAKGIKAVIARNNPSGGAPLLINQSNYSQIVAFVSGATLLAGKKPQDSLISQVSSEKPLPSEDLPKLYALFKSVPLDVIGKGLDLLAKNQLNHVDNSISNEYIPLIAAVTILQVMTISQAQKLLEYGKVIKDPDLSTVAAHFVASNIIPRIVAEDIVGQKLASVPLFTDNLQALRNAATIASTDIFNKALSGDQWLAFGTFYAGALSGLLTAIMSVASGNPSGVVGALPQALLAAGAFKYSQGENPLAVVTQPLSKAVKSSAESKEVAINTARIDVINITGPLSSEDLQLVTDPKLITVLLDVAKQGFSLANFEHRLRGFPIYSKYLAYASQYSSNRPMLASILEVLAKSYSILEVKDPETYIAKVGRYYGITKEYLQPNPRANV